MAEDFGIVEGANGRIFVILDPTCGVEKSRILELLSEMGVDPSAVIFMDPSEACELTDLQDDTILIPLNEETCNAVELDDAARHCGQAGGGVVVVFAAGFPYEGLHPIAEKYGTQCGWSADELNTIIDGEAADSPTDGTGSRRKRPSAEQVTC